MSEVVMVNDLSGMNVKLGQRELIPVAEAHGWLRETASGKGFLRSVLSVQTKHRKPNGETITRRASHLSVERVFELFAGPFVLSSLPAFIGSFSVAGAVGEMPGVSSASILLSLVGTMFVVPFGVGAIATAAMLPFYKPYQQKYVHMQSQLMRLQGEGMKVWLRARYNIQVADSIQEFISTHVLQGTPEMYFDDVDGRWWTMKFNKAEEAYYVVPKSVEVSMADAPSGLEKQADVILSVGAAHLDGELGQFGTRIDARLTQLHKFALSVEEAHVLSRTVEDAREAVTGFERLELLGAAESGAAYLLDVLRLLDAELESIVQAKVTEETKALLARKQRAAARQDMVGV
jgi:hypothetical protein